MQFRALVFDLDGTLVDSLDDISTHLLSALAEHGLPLPTRPEIAHWVGYGADALVARAVPDPAHAAAVLDSFRAHYRARPVITTAIYPGLADTLDAIAPGRALAILSNKPHALTVAIAGQLLARWPFHPICGQDASRPRKPDPAGVLAILAEHGVAPAEAAMIGDSEVDVATARAAGMRAVAVSWGLRPLDALAGADEIVHTPAQLTALLSA